MHYLLKYKKALKIFAISICSILVLLYALYYIFLTSGPYDRVEVRWRYKMTVQIDTPEGVKAGSAVREVRHSAAASLRTGKWAGGSHDVKGEAVVVDLGQRGAVFALMTGGPFGADHWWHVVTTQAFPPPADTGAGLPDGARYYAALASTAPVELPPGAYPAFVYFRDPKDPKTVESLLSFKKESDAYNAPWVIAQDRFAEVFGEGVALKSVTIEMTREPVTTGVVERYLGWLKSIKSNIDGTSVTMSNELHNVLHKAHFKVGE